MVWARRARGSVSGRAGLPSVPRQEAGRGPAAGSGTDARGVLRSGPPDTPAAGALGAPRGGGLRGPAWGGRRTPVARRCGRTIPLGRQGWHERGRAACAGSGRRVILTCLVDYNRDGGRCCQCRQLSRGGKITPRAGLSPARRVPSGRDARGGRCGIAPRLQKQMPFHFSWRRVCFSPCPEALAPAAEHSAVGSVPGAGRDRPSRPGSAPRTDEGDRQFGAKAFPATTAPVIGAPARAPGGRRRAVPGRQRPAALERIMRRWENSRRRVFAHAWKMSPPVRGMPGP
jgi:hypothetical protein